MPVAAITALQAVRDKARLQSGQRVLINGASGGVGSFAVQIAKAMGAHVTAVCSTRNVEMVRALGADEVIDYTQNDFTEGEPRFDAVIDMIGNHSLLQMLQVVKPDGSLVLVGSIQMNPWWGPLVRPGRAWLLSFFVSQRLEPMLAEIKVDDLQVLTRYAEAGQLQAVIDASYSLAEVPPRSPMSKADGPAARWSSRSGESGLRVIPIACRLAAVPRAHVASRHSQQS